VTPRSDVVEPGDIEELIRRTTKALKLLRSARKGSRSRSTVLRQDIDALLSRSPVSAAAPLGDQLLDTLANEIHRRFQSTRLPVRIPDLLRAVGAPTEEAKRVLLDGAARGLFELEPESGMGRLSREDAELCPPGPMGTRLSWVVIRQQKGMN